MQQNIYNMQKTRGTSKYKGVHLVKKLKIKKWRVQIGRKAIGHFENEKDAAKFYDLNIKKIYGEFAWLNFP